MVDISLLNKIDWNFTKCKTNYATHGFHPYPAKFIPQIPKNLIKIFSNKNEVIYDPFCGCGTTIVEAILEERNAVGNDVSPLAVLISKVKSTYLAPEKIKKLKKYLFYIEEEINNLYIKEKPKITKENLLNEVNIPRVDYWFDENIIIELLIIKKVIKTIDDDDISDFLKVAFSSIIVQVSFQDSNTRYTRVNKNIKNKDVIIKLKNQLNKMIKGIQFLEKCKLYKPTLIAADTRNIVSIQENSVDLVITSPPYPNAYDYHLYHKYRMYWLDMDPKRLKENEIGSHANYSKKNGLTVMDFEKNMELCFINISKFLKKNKYFCIVIGDSILKGKKIKNDELLKKVSLNTNFNLKYKMERKINLSKKSFNPLIGNIKKEKILIFKNEK